MPHRRNKNHQIVKESSWWRRRSLLEKILVVICLLAACAVIALSLTLYVLNISSSCLRQAQAEPLESTEDPGYVYTIGGKNKSEETTESNKKQPTSNGRCETRGCLMAASRTMTHLDESIDPCENFYEFACGNYLKNTFIPEEKITVDLSSTVDDLVRGQLRTIINEPPLSNEAKPFRLAKNLNLACLNKTIIEERGIKPLADILEAYGGWPVVKGDSWLDGGFDWIETIKKFRRMGLDTSVIFAFRVLTDLKNSNRRILDIDEPSRELAREYLINGLNDRTVKAYYSFMVDNAIIFGANKSRAEMELKESLEYEIKLANISLPREERRNASLLYNPYTIKQLQESYPYMNWLDYINAMLPTGLDVDESEIVTNSVPTYFKELGNILNVTSKRTIANYLLWRAVLTTSGTLTSELRQRKLEFYKAVYGLQGEEPRWKECIQFASYKLPISVGALYVRKYFSEKSRKAAIDLVENIRHEFIDILQNVTWMDETTRGEAIKKAQMLETHIGYPNELNDINKLKQYYNDLEIEPDNLLLNTLRIEVFDTDRAFNKLRKAVNKTDWESHSTPSSVGAYYSSPENSINFAAAILQDRYFSADRPNYMNYASIGSIIGHEITHGFDDQGRQYDFNGNLVDWWDPETQNQFLEKAQCIIEQYGNYTDLKTKLSLNGINTQGENIADNGGTKEAYYAYKNWVQHNGPEGVLPGLNYNQQQLFWISFAQSRCSVSRDEFSENQITTGFHSPNEFRVTGVIHNMPEFAYDFNCPVGTKMNPTKKCKVW